ncbi:TraM recognition domain-containing protein [uncultured Tateyamaria sp.]|uniref:TraM recognition domain-containing protein n=1 Tax=Tateyamaria sp. 1078 TaxID=3417464 RepID=UPI002635D19B|nr:TraM recognition domain-containing protein [uncultured Tateyamaria sp.]
MLLKNVLFSPFYIARWMLRRLVKKLGQKGFFYVTMIVAFMSIDMVFPAVGGSLSTIVFILGPAILMGITFEIIKRLDGTMPQFIALASYMAFAGVYALFRAWSKAAESSLPEIVGPLSKWIFGPLVNFVIGLVGALLGNPRAVPMPVWGPMPLGEHILAMDPYLSALGLLVLLWSLSILTYGTKRYGGETKMTDDQKALAKNRLTPPWQANWVLHGVRGNLYRLVRNLMRHPVLQVDEMIVGFGPPVLYQPWFWPLWIVNRSLARVRNVAMTPFDPRQMIVARFENGALIIGGAGAGKTLIQIPWLMLSRSNKILIETQGNVFDKDLPLIRAAGRTLHVISSDLGADTVTINVLGTIDPAHQDFWDQVMRISSLIIQERGEHGTLERCTRELVACIIGNVVFFARVIGDEARLDVVYDYLSDPKLAKELKFWAAEGHPAFRELCLTLVGRTEDPEFLNSLGAIFSPELGFLAHPIKRAMVCGTGQQVFDPTDMLNDDKIDVAIQISQDSIETSGALLRLLLGLLLEPRIRLSAKDAKATPAKGVTVWIDELAAFSGPTPGSGAPMLKEIVDFHRQKGVRFVYAAQSIQQIDTGWGDGTYNKWANSAMVRVFGKVGADPELDQHITEVAGKTLSDKFEKIPGAGGGYRAYQRVFEPIDLLPQYVLSKTGVSQMIAFVRRDGPGLVKLRLWRPAHFTHPVLGRLLKKAMSRFGGRPTSLSPELYGSLIDNARATMEAASHPPTAGDPDDNYPPKDAA